MNRHVLRVLMATLMAFGIAAKVHAQCDVLDTQWENVGPTPTNYGLGGGWITGVPDPVNSVIPTDPKGIYERYFTPNPGVTRIDAVRVGLGGLFDPNDDMTFQVAVYDDDGAGAPGAFVGGQAGISPTALGVPQNDPSTNQYQDFWIDLPSNPVPTTGSFHVGVEIFPGGASDVLVVITSCLGPVSCPVAEGESDASNHIFTTSFGYENLQTDYGADFDVNIVPRVIEPATIGGLAWLDLNGNGVFDPGAPDNETAIDGLVLYLDENGNNIKDPGEPEAATDQGRYAFHCLDAGNYQVAIHAPTIPASVELSTGMDPTAVNLTATQIVEDIDFGFMPVFDLAIADLALDEGNAGTTSFDFTVSLSYPSLDTVDVDFTTVADTAQAGSDFVAASGTASFAPDELVQTITVDVLGDMILEPDETFFVTLSNPVNADIADGSATGTIIDDDFLIFRDSLESH